MIKTYGILLIGLLILGCKEKTDKKIIVEKKVEFNQEIVNKLEKMAEIDQIVASNAFPPKNYSNLSQQQWEKFKDSVYLKNQKLAEDIFNKHGFVGYDIVGKKGSANFWLIVQHSDHNSDFQNNVLEKMKIEVENNNADSKSYTLLIDRVKLNNGKKQVYGTQVEYYPETGQAFAKRLADSTTVNERRKLVGLKPIEVYLNEMSKMHFEMNKEYFAEKGITEPKLYKSE